MDDSTTGHHQPDQATGHAEPAPPVVTTGPAAPLDGVYGFVYEVMRDAERVLEIATTNRPPHILRADLLRMRTCLDEALFHLMLARVHLTVEGGIIRGMHRTHPYGWPDPARLTRSRGDETVTTMQWHRDLVTAPSQLRDRAYLLWPTEKGGYFRLVAAARHNPDNQAEVRVLMDGGELLVFGEFDRVLKRRYERGHHPTEASFVPALIPADASTEEAIRSYVASETGFGRPADIETVRRQCTEAVKAAYWRGGGDPDAEFFALPHTP